MRSIDAQFHLKVEIHLEPPLETHPYILAKEIQHQQGQQFYLSYQQQKQSFIVQQVKWFLSKQHPSHLTLFFLNNSFFSQVFRFFPQVYHSFFLLFFVFHSSLISLALFFSLNFIWFSHTSLGDNSLRIIFCSLCLKEMLFVNPSCIAFVSYCDTLYLDIHVRKKNI